MTHVTTDVTKASTMSNVYKIASNPFTIPFDLNHCFLFPYGNTPASDLTRGCQTNSDLDFLLLGCGDIRNILFTIKSLIEDNSKCKNIHFHLNDREDVILARNLVLFNILDVIDPDKDEDIDFLWSVWYDLAIPKDYSKRLAYIMQDILQNPKLRVEYGMKETEEEIKRVLKYWLKGNMENARIKCVGYSKECLEAAMMSEMNMIPIQTYEDVQVNEWVQEIHKFLEERSTYKGTSNGPINRFANPTLLCPHVNGLRAYPDGTPFHAYNLYGLSEGQSLFHNCLFQLKTMVRAWRQFTSGQDSNVKVFLWLGNCLTLCNHTLPADMKFDFIDTSNVVDHMGFLHLLVSCSDRLKPSGVLITETLSGCAFLESMEHYLDFCIRIPSSFFPTMLNLRLAENFEMGTSEPRTIGCHLGSDRVIIRWLEAGKEAEPININDSPDVLEIFRALVQTCLPLQTKITSGETCMTSSLLVHIVRKMKDNVVGGAKTLLDIIINSQPSLKTKSGYVFYPYENSLRVTWSAYRDQLGCDWPRGHTDHSILMLDIEISPICEAGIDQEIYQRVIVFMNPEDNLTIKRQVPPTEPWFFVTTIAYEVVGKIKLLLPSDVFETLGHSACLTISNRFGFEELVFVPISIKEDPRVKIVECLKLAFKPRREEEITRHLTVTEYEDRYEIHLKWSDGLGERSNLKVERSSDPTELLILSGSGSSTCRFRCPLLEIPTVLSISNNSWKITATKDLSVLNGPMILTYRRLDIGKCTTVTKTPEQLQKILSTNITHETMKRRGIDTNDPLFKVAKHVLNILKLAITKHPLNPLFRTYGISVKERDYGQTFGTVNNDIFIYFRKCHMVRGILTLDIDWVDFEKVNLYINKGKITKKEVDLYFHTHCGQYEATHHHFDVTKEEALLLRKWLLLNTMKSKQRQKGQRCQWVFNSFLQPLFTINNNNVHETQMRAVTGKVYTQPNFVSTEKVRSTSEKVCSSCSCQAPLLRSCTRCHSAFYCGKECQMRDWPKHRQLCKSNKPPNPIATNIVPTRLEKVCSSCSKQTSHLKACTQCHLAFYCGTECQRKHWPNHKQSCKVDTQTNLIATEQIQTKIEKICSSCSRHVPRLSACARCHKTFYCGKECQIRDWPNHKQLCRSKMQ